MGFSCGCDEDPPEFFNTSEPKARKEHTCCECGHTITPGQTYRSATGKWFGDVNTYKTCERCADLGEAFRDLGYCTAFGELFSDYSDWLSYGDPIRMDQDDPASGHSRAIAIQERHRNWCPPTSPNCTDGEGK